MSELVRTNSGIKIAKGTYSNYQALANKDSSVIYFTADSSVYTKAIYVNMGELETKMYFYDSSIDSAEGYYYKWKNDDVSPSLVYTSQNVGLPPLIGSSVTPAASVAHPIGRVSSHIDGGELYLGENHIGSNVKDAWYDSSADVLTVVKLNGDSFSINLLNWATAIKNVLIGNPTDASTADTIWGAKKSGVTSIGIDGGISGIRLTGDVSLTSPSYHNHKINIKNYGNVISLDASLYDVSLSSNSNNPNFAKVYTIKQGNSEIGTIDIPKDQFLQSVQYIKASVDDVSLGFAYGMGATIKVGDPYLKMVVNIDKKTITSRLKDSSGGIFYSIHTYDSSTPGHHTYKWAHTAGYNYFKYLYTNEYDPTIDSSVYNENSDSSKVGEVKYKSADITYIPLKGLVDIYTAGNYIDISNNVISVKTGSTATGYLTGSNILSNDIQGWYVNKNRSIDGNLQSLDTTLHKADSSISILDSSVRAMEPYYVWYTI